MYERGAVSAFSSSDLARGSMRSCGGWILRRLLFAGSHDPDLEIFAAPGNPGIAELATIVDISLRTLKPLPTGPRQTPSTSSSWTDSYAGW